MMPEGENDDNSTVSKYAINEILVDLILSNEPHSPR